MAIIRRYLIFIVSYAYFVLIIHARWHEIHTSLWSLWNRVYMECCLSPPSKFTWHSLIITENISPVFFCISCLTESQILQIHACWKCGPCHLGATCLAGQKKCWLVVNWTLKTYFNQLWTKLKIFYWIRIYLLQNNRCFFWVCCCCLFVCFVLLCFVLFSGSIVSNSKYVAPDNKKNVLWVQYHIHMLHI